MRYPQSRKYLVSEDALSLDNCNRRKVEELLLGDGNSYSGLTLSNIILR